MIGAKGSIIVGDGELKAENITDYTQEIQYGISGVEHTMNLSGYITPIEKKEPSKLKELYVKVRFQDGYRDYIYKTVETDLKPGDKVLVDSKNKLGLAKVVSYSDAQPNRGDDWYSWVLEKVDLDMLRMLLNEKKDSINAS